MQLDPSTFQADPELLRALEECATAVEIPTEHILFRQGDPPIGLYVLTKGGATVTMKSEDGDPIMSMEAASGSVLGLPAVVGNQPYSLSARAHHGSWVGFVSRAKFNVLIQADPSLMVKVLQVLANEVRSARLAISKF